jgi:hypothetical protein
VVEHILCNTDPSLYIIAHYFLDPKHPRELSATALLRGIIRQIVYQLQITGRLPHEFLTMLQELFTSRNTFYSCAKLHHILQKLLTASYRCAIIVDGLHEMSEKDVSALLHVFRHLSSQSSLTEKIKIAIFCREQVGRNVNIETALPNVIRLSLTHDLLANDIAFFIEQRIQQKTLYERQLTDNEALMDQVQSTLKENGGKMFVISNPNFYELDNNTRKVPMD